MPTASQTQVEARTSDLVLKSLCDPRASVFDRAQVDTVVDIGDLVDPRFDADRFFDENHPTQGMQTLLRQVFERLCGSSPQGVFRLKQAMGGGKTHNMVAAGLLAKHPHLRRAVLSKLGVSADNRDIAVAAFTGREGSVQDFLWLEIARQLHRADRLRDAEADVPGQTAWASIIGDRPTLILLDELPPYFELLATKQVGLQQTEADRLAIALGNLMSAILSDRLPNCCLVISDLAGSWAGGTAQLQRAINNTMNEINRGAMDITPVRMDGTELYAILRTRLFKSLPTSRQISEVAEAYAGAYRVAVQQGAMPAALERWAAEIPTTYPFHPGMQDLFARFRENPGFQQTREMLRLSRRLVNGLWAAGAEGQMLIHPHHVDFNDTETQNVLDRINAALLNARSRDVARGGGATAEALSAQPGLEAAGNAAKAVFLSSLAIAPNAIVGLTAEEVSAYLCAPGQDVSRYGVGLLTAIEDDSWYLHRRTDGRWVYRDVKNVTSAIRDRAQIAMAGDGPRKEAQARLRDIFKPGAARDRGQGEGRLAYQELLVFPTVEDIQAAMDADKVVLAVTEPDPTGLNPALKAVWANQAWRNRLMFLCGTAQFTNVLQAAAFKKAADDQLAEFAGQRLPDGAPEMVQAKDIVTRSGTAFLSALRETFTLLHFPDLTSGELRAKPLRLEFAENRFVGETAILDTLKDEQKFRDDLESDALRNEFVDMIFVQNPAKWEDLERECARRPDWYFHPPGGLRTLKTAAMRHDLWREDGGGYVRRGPFPPEPTEVVVTERVPQDDHGRVVLSVTAKRGDSVHWEVGPTPPTAASARVENGELVTDEMRVTFLALDSTGRAPTGNTLTWENRLRVKAETPYRDGSFRLRLKAVPGRGSTLRYTFDGSDPKLGGGVYDDEAVVPAGTRVILAVAENGGVYSRVERIDVPDAPEPGGDGRPAIDPARPAQWASRFMFGERRRVFAALECLARLGVQLGGVRLNVQVQGDSTRFLELTHGAAVFRTPDEVEAMVSELETKLAAQEQPNLQLAASRLSFPTGRALVEAARELGIALDAGEITAA
jgi:hypothetical protein